MSFAPVLALVGAIVALWMVPPALLAWLDGTSDLAALAGSCALALSVSAVLFWLARRSRHDRRRLRLGEAFGVVTFSWILASALGALPYRLSGTLPTWWDCFFEAMSGFSTTGATVIADLEALPRGILLWRALTQWIGGMGIIVLGLAVLPLLGLGAMELYKAEVPTPMPEKLTPRLHQTAMLLWLTYLALTALETALLTLAGLDPFDALTHSLTTLATGGFSNYNDGVAHFQNPGVQGILALFMFLSGANFVLIFRVLRGQWSAPWQDEEFRCYCWTLAGATAVVAAALWLRDLGSPAAALGEAAFQVIAMATTTGFVSADSQLWPPLCQCLLVLLMLLGGCAGSTSGGIKHLRTLILTKAIGSEMIRLLQPQRVLVLRFNGRPLKAELSSSVAAFFAVYVLALVAFTLALTALGLDLGASFSSVLSCLSNGGPLPALAAMPRDLVVLSGPVKGVLWACMLLGRLELMTVLVLFLPTAWR